MSTIYITEYLDNTSPNAWTLDGLAEWCINTYSHDKKKSLEYMKTALESVIENQGVGRSNFMFAAMLSSKQITT